MVKPQLPEPRFGEPLADRNETESPSFQTNQPRLAWSSFLYALFVFPAVKLPLRRSTPDLSTEVTPSGGTRADPPRLIRPPRSSPADPARVTPTKVGSRGSALILVAFAALLDKQSLEVGQRLGLR